MAILLNLLYQALASESDAVTLMSLNSYSGFRKIVSREERFGFIPLKIMSDQLAYKLKTIILPAILDSGVSLFGMISKLVSFFF